MGERIKKINWRFVFVMFVGNVILGLGVAIFKLSGLGNDPFTGMAMGLAECIGIEYPRFVILLNVGFFVIEIIWGRKLIGVGTIVNALLLGYFVTFFYNLVTSVINAPEQMVLRVAPYDSISLIMADRWSKFPYFWCRVFTDGISALVCWLSGGIVGLGTLVGAFGFGPFVQFFDTHFTSKILEKCNK